MTNDFKKQYEHPLWQKKRLEALEDASWKCDDCHAKDKQLHVHHRTYKKGCKVWEYDLDELQVLCEDCHKKIHAFIEMRKETEEMFRKIMDSEDADIGCLHAYLKATIEDGNEDGSTVFDMGKFYFDGISQFYGLPTSLVSRKGFSTVDQFRSAQRTMERFFQELT